MNLRTANTLVIAAFLVSAAGAAWTAAAFYRELTTAREAQLLGPLVSDEDPGLREATDAFLSRHFSSSSPRVSCRHVFFGRDNLYSFIEFSCEPAADEPAAAAAAPAKGLARLEIDANGRPKRIDVLETGKTRERSMKGLFPPEVLSWMPVGPADR